MEQTGTAFKKKRPQQNGRKVALIGAHTHAGELVQGHVWKLIHQVLTFIENKLCWALAIFFFFSWFIQLQLKSAPPEEKCHYMLRLSCIRSDAAVSYVVKTPSIHAQHQQRLQYLCIAILCFFFRRCRILAPLLLQCALEWYHFSCGRLSSSQHVP